MRRMVCIVCLSVLLIASASAQFPLENHYKVYNIMPPFTYTANILLMDQFGDYQVSFLTLEKFATPVEKNGEPILYPELHHTWWRIDVPQAPGWNITIDNQFGEQVWHVDNPQYLVLPARKFEPGPPLPFNHYLAYNAIGPDVAVPVHLVDQFGIFDGVAMTPEFFLNPVQKTADGVVYPIIDQEAHLACYRLDPPWTYLIPVVAFDQFGEWQFDLIDHDCLCVPSFKQVVVQTESSTWGEIKSLYR